jgi:arabinose-5-phosphate isomerase
MSSAAESQLIAFSDLEQIREARAIIQDEAAALNELAQRLDTDFCTAAYTLYECTGHVIVTGMGKAGLIGQKIAATLSSTGTPAHFLHPAEAVHGDLGCLRGNDILLVLSNSGETEEICRLLPVVRGMRIPIVAITATHASTLGSQATVTVSLGRLREAGLHGLAPSTSTTAMLALGDALALVLSRMKGLTPRQFAVFHPSGSLGKQLKRVEEIMRRSGDLRIAPTASTVREVFVSLSKPGRRTGAVMLVDADGRLCGLFTDSDLARLMECRRELQLDRPIAEVMTSQPLTVGSETLLSEVVEILSDNKVSELPVVDNDGKPIGLIDITDVIGLMPGETAE